MTTTEPSKELNSDMVADQLKALGAELISVADDQIANRPIGKPGDIPFADMTEDIGQKPIVGKI